MSDFDDNGRRIPDEDERYEALAERVRRATWCKCGRPDWPGQCPGWRACPLAHIEPEYRDEARLDARDRAADINAVLKGGAL